MKILVLGIGQTMRGDDAAGLETVRLWRVRYPDSASKVQVELFELPGLALLNVLEGRDMAVLVDAVQTSRSPGTILRLGPDELASFTPGTGFTHGWGVAESLQLGRSLYPWLDKCQITLIGIVGKDFKLGMKLNPEVKGALYQAADSVEREIQNVMGKNKSGG
jgi:hydrogenase maturation protease